MKFVITAGPTREPIDPIRYLSNRSSGKMGYAIAEAALESGHDVLLISGPVNLNPPPGAKVISILTSDEMYDAVHDHLHACDVLVMCAAVADYKPAKVSAQKIKKRHAPLLLELIPTRDILASVAKPDRQFLLVGFAAETNDLEEYAQKKLRQKNCDLIVANNVLTGIDSDENEVTIFSRTGEQQRISRAPKKNIARALVKLFLNSCEKRLTKKM
ncbi:MAG: bifunctional phosphopantothenoylcysteine decarboxylase/phosphopantothenate--cysteine ligase CoaBC [Chthoniobacterales bacterium]